MSIGNEMRDRGWRTTSFRYSKEIRDTSLGPTSVVILSVAIVVVLFNGTEISKQKFPFRISGEIRRVWIQWGSSAGGGGSLNSECAFQERNGTCTWLDYGDREIIFVSSSCPLAVTGWARSDTPNGWTSCQGIGNDGVWMVGGRDGMYRRRIGRYWKRLRPNKDIRLREDLIISTI